jgi:hypothetical protein
MYILAHECTSLSPKERGMWVLIVFIIITIPEKLDYISIPLNPRFSPINKLVMPQWQ